MERLCKQGAKRALTATTLVLVDEDNLKSAMSETAMGKGRLWKWFPHAQNVPR